MKNIKKNFILFSLIILFLFKSNLYSYVKGVHYWGNSWALMFWNSFEINKIDYDFKKIKKDGFNAVILAIPWGEFQPSLNPVKFNNFAIKRLKLLMHKALKYNLKVILRVSYAWDFYPDVTPALNERFLKIFYNSQMLNSWCLYLKKIYTIANKYPNFLSGFLTWEDFLYFFKFTKGNRVKNAHLVGFTNFLKNRYSLKYVSKVYGFKFHSWQNVFIPRSEDPGFNLFLEYWDYLLINRILHYGKKYFPKLSMEIRIDKDPIYSKNHKISFWYDHIQQYKAPLDTFAIYYSPAWGAKNRWDYELPDKTLKRFQIMLKEVKSKISNKNIFIDQFNFYDDSPPSIGKTIIHPGFLSQFLEKSCYLLRKYTTGYALWTYKDYEGSMVFNGFFEVGEKGWNIKGKAKVLKINNDNMIKLFSNSTINQYISKTRTNVGWFYFYKKINLCFTAFSDKNNSLLEVGVNKEIRKKILVNYKKKQYCFKFPYQPDYNLYFHSKRGNVILDDVRLFGCVQKQLLYSTDYQPECLLNDIRKLNRCLK